MSSYDSTAATAAVVDVNAELIHRSPNAHTAKKVLSSVLAQHRSSSEQAGGSSSSNSSAADYRATFPSRRLSYLGLRRADDAESSTVPSGQGHSHDTSLKDGVSGKRRPTLPDLERISVPRLRHQASSATIRSGDTSADTSRSTFQASPNQPNQSSGPGALREERRKRSAILEQDVSQLRSESRLESRASTSRASESSGVAYSRTSSSNTPQTPQLGDSADTSGTEGSGPVIANRRRKKSSTSSAGRKAAAAARAAEEEGQLDEQHRGFRRRDIYDSIHAPDAHRSPHIGRTTDRWQSSRTPRRGDNSFEATDEGDSGGGPNYRRNTIMASDRKLWPASDGIGDSSGEWQTSSPRAGSHSRRFASDADVDPSRAAMSGLHVRSDATTSKRMTNGRSARADEIGEPLNRALLDSPSEGARQRKSSTSSSSLSHRSSGAASDLHRSISRSSLRRAANRDVFDDVPPPLPRQSAQQLLEYRRGDGQASSARVSNLDQLQARLDDLTNPANSIRNSSRASSHASRARSIVSSTPSTSHTTSSSTSNYPATEPRRKPTSTQDVSNPSPESRLTRSVGASGIRRAQAGSRLAGNVEGRATPSSGTIYPRRSASRLASGNHATPMRSVSRLASGGATLRTSSRLERSDANTPLHARNLLNSVDVLEREMLGTHADGSADADQGANLIESMREAGDAAIDINARLRAMVQSILGLQIDDELGKFGEEARREMLGTLDKNLSAALRESDQQVRNLTEAIMAMAQLGANRSNRGDGSVAAAIHSSPTVRGTSSPGSARQNVRMSIAVQSPQHERLTADERAMRTHRRSSLDLRRARTLLSTFEQPPQASTTDAQ